MRAWNWNITNSEISYFLPDYAPIFSDMTVQKNVPRLCTRSICGWNLFQPLGLRGYECSRPHPTTCGSELVQRLKRITEYGLILLELWCSLCHRLCPKWQINAGQRLCAEPSSTTVTQHWTSIASPSVCWEMNTNMAQCWFNVSPTSTTLGQH